MSAVARDVQKHLPPVSRPPGLLAVTFKDRAALHQAYMPFVQNGALFIATHVAYALGDEVFMVVSLPEDAAKHSSTGRVIWITPKGATPRRPAGIGVQLQPGPLQKKIESHLAAQPLLQEKATHTL